MTKTTSFGPFLGVNTRLPDSALRVATSQLNGQYLRDALNVEVDNALKLRRRKAAQRVAPLVGAHSLRMLSDSSGLLVRDGALWQFTLSANGFGVRFIAPLSSNAPLRYLASADGGVYAASELDFLPLFPDAAGNYARSSLIPSGLVPTARVLAENAPPLVIPPPPPLMPYYLFTPPARATEPGSTPPGSTEPGVMVWQPEGWWWLPAPEDSTRGGVYVGAAPESGGAWRHIPGETAEEGGVWLWTSEPATTPVEPFTPPPEGTVVCGLVEPPQGATVTPLLARNDAAPEEQRPNVVVWNMARRVPLPYPNDSYNLGNWSLVSGQTWRYTPPTPAERPQDAWADQYQFVFPETFEWTAPGDTPGVWTRTRFSSDTTYPLRYEGWTWTAQPNLLQWGMTSLSSSHDAGDGIRVYHFIDDDGVEILKFTTTRQITIWSPLTAAEQNIRSKVWFLPPLASSAVYVRYVERSNNVYANSPVFGAPTWPKNEQGAYVPPLTGGGRLKIKAPVRVVAWYDVPERAPKIWGHETGEAVYVSSSESGGSSIRAVGNTILWP